MQRIIVTVEKGKGGELRLALDNPGTGTDPDEERIAAAINKVVRGVLQHFMRTFDREGLS